jgi:subtilisin family serine protease
MTEGSREIVVAVIDSGVDYNHPDLKNNIWFNAAERYGQAGVDDDANGYIDDVYGWDFVSNRPNAMDDNNHGTHCAGIIGAERNGVGVVGISPKVRIMPLKFLGSNGSGDLYAALLAIRYATQMGARVISNSWGGGGFSQMMNSAIQEAVSRGVVVVAAAGNSAMNTDSTPTFPAGYPQVISVGSSDASDSLSTFSNYGVQSVLVAAPGSEILSTVPGSRLATFSGTSMAAPQVSGAIALALSLKPSATVAEIRQKLCDTSVGILTSRVKCGRMDVEAFVGSFR